MCVLLPDPPTGQGWASVLGGDGFDAEWHDKNDQLVMVSRLYYNDIWRSTNGTRSFEPAQAGLEDVGDDNGQFIVSLANSKDNPDVVFTIGQTGIWRSENFGENWEGFRPPPALWEGRQMAARFVSHWPTPTLYGRGTGLAIVITIVARYFFLPIKG